MIHQSEQADSRTAVQGYEAGRRGEVSSHHGADSRCDRVTACRHQRHLNAPFAGGLVSIAIWSLLSARAETREPARTLHRTPRAVTAPL